MPDHARRRRRAGQILRMTLNCAPRMPGMWGRSRIRQRFQSFGEQRSGFLFPARQLRPFVSLSCSREDDRSASSARGSCSQRVN